LRQQYLQTEVAEIPMADRLAMTPRHSNRPVALLSVTLTTMMAQRREYSSHRFRKSKVPKKLKGKKERIKGP
jgi:hypothetical protein